MDDDDENNNHHAIDLQNDDVVGDGHNDEVDNDNETSRKCLPNFLYPPIVNNPSQGAPAPPMGIFCLFT